MAFPAPLGVASPRQWQPAWPGARMIEVFPALSWPSFQVWKLAVSWDGSDEP